LHLFNEEFVKPNKKHIFIPVEWIALFRNKLIIPIDEFAFSMADLDWVKQKKQRNFPNILAKLKEKAASVDYCI